MEIGPSEAETFGTAFLFKLVRRGLQGVKLVISDALVGIRGAGRKNPDGDLATLRPCIP